MSDDHGASCRGAGLSSGRQFPTTADHANGGGIAMRIARGIAAALLALALAAGCTSASDGGQGAPDDGSKEADRYLGFDACEEFLTRQLSAGGIDDVVLPDPYEDDGEVRFEVDGDEVTVESHYRVGDIEQPFKCIVRDDGDEWTRVELDYLGEGDDSAPERNDTGLDAEVASWQVCSDDPQAVFADAGTDDPVEAAEYVAEVYEPNIRPNAVRGCLAGLRGAPAPAEHCEQEPDFYGCAEGAAAPTTATPTTETAPSTTYAGERAVVYEVLGEAFSATVWYHTNDAVEEVEEAPLPFRREFRADEVGLMSVTAFVPDYEFAGTIMCRVTLAGVVIAEESASGPAPSVDCLGSEP